MASRIQFPKNPGGGKDNGDQKAKLAAIRGRVLELATELYHMMPGGMTVDIMVPLGKIVTVNQPKQFGSLIITKPVMRDNIRGR